MEAVTHWRLNRKETEQERTREVGGEMRLEIVAFGFLISVIYGVKEHY